GWEERTRRACLILSDRTGDTELLIELLTDIKEVFESAQVDRLRSTTLVEKLKVLEGRPWKDSRLNVHKLAKMLRPLGIGPKQVWFDKNTNKQGYMREWFADAFNRYL